MEVTLKVIKFTIIVIMFFVICGCQQSDNALNDYEQTIAELEMLNEALNADLKELKEDNRVLQEMNNDLQSKVSMLTTQKNNSQLKEQSVARYSNGFVKFIETKASVATFFTLTLIGYDTELYDDPFEVLDFSNGETPTAKFKVFGTLYNFKIVKVDWNSDFSDYTIKEEICNLDVVRNKSIVFDSVLAEGYPNELLIWENEDGESKYYRISHDGYGFANIVLICDEYSNEK